MSTYERERQGATLPRELRKWNRHSLHYYPEHALIRPGLGSSFSSTHIFFFRKDQDEFDEHDGGQTRKREGRNESS